MGVGGFLFVLRFPAQNRPLWPWGAFILRLRFLASMVFSFFRTGPTVLALRIVHRQSESPQVEVRLLTSDDVTVALDVLLDDSSTPEAQTWALAILELDDSPARKYTEGSEIPPLSYSGAYWESKCWSGSSSDHEDLPNSYSGTVKHGDWCSFSRSFRESKHFSRSSVSP